MEAPHRKPMTTIHIFAQLLVIVLAFSFFAALFYEIGKREAQKNFADEMLKEYARGIRRATPETPLLRSRTL